MFLVMHEQLTEKNFLLVAMHHYDNVQCTSIAEFEQDIKRFNYLNKLFNRYHNKNELKERLILNHIIILTNVFGEVVVDLLFFKTDEKYWSYLATFLVYLNKLPDQVNHYMNVDCQSIQLDMGIIEVLRRV